MGGEGEMYGKSNKAIYITIYNDSQGEFAIWLRKLKQGLCINLEGWDGEGDERAVQKGEDMSKFDGKQQNCKTSILQ